LLLYVYYTLKKVTGPSLIADIKEYPAKNVLVLKDVYKLTPDRPPAPAPPPSLLTKGLKMKRLLFQILYSHPQAMDIVDMAIH
jgi:hypothetical protein